jgi:KDO2-lipid IV(A) lauroyltransferase
VIVYPLSLLPLWISYRFADIFYLLCITLFPYRKKVITGNLKRSFPSKSEAEIRAIRRKFYRHFANMLIEGIKNLSISEKELMKRYKIVNPEVMQSLYNKEKSVLLVSAHYLNWEWMITGLPLFFPHQAVGIGMPLSNGFWDKKINGLRARFGMHVIHSKIVKETFDKYQEHHIPIATLTLSDQSPGDSRKSYWMRFLNQQTAVLFGAEQLANTYNHSVVFYLPKQVKRGYYEIELELISEDPKELHWGELTEIHTKRLEERIEQEPAPWLWSHKRWKREIPLDLNLLQSTQREKFNRTFRNH